MKKPLPGWKRKLKKLECISSFLRTVFASQLIEPRDIIYVSYWIRTYQTGFCVQEIEMLLQIYSHQEIGGSVQKQENRLLPRNRCFMWFFASWRWIVLNYDYNDFLKERLNFLRM